MNSKNMPKVSVILPTYNRAHLIERAIRSVLNQTYRDFELIVIDGCSTDKTEEVVNSINDSRIRYIREDRKNGVGASRNTGIRAAKGELIAFQDSDDEWLPEKLDTQLELFDNAPPGVGVVYTDMFRINNDGRIEYWHSPTVLKDRIINPKTLDYQVFMLAIQSTLIRKECFYNAGFFDEKFPQLEDLDLLIRISKYYHFIHIKEPLVKYYATEGISSNKTTFIARRLLLEEYFNDFSINNKFFANQYFKIGHSLLSNERFGEGRSYFIKAIIIDPLNIRILLTTIISLFGQKIYDDIINIYAIIKYKLLGVQKNINPL